jgi:LacI family transcriptional regulator
MPPEKVTIAQVAAEAGVSAMTVSNVVNGRAGASDATRQRVLKVVERLGYKPNASARTLSSGRTGLIGIIALDLISEYAHEIVRGIAVELADDERELLLNVSIDAIRERERVDFFSHGLVDGLILIAPALEPRTVEFIQDKGLPTVVIDPRRLGVGLPRVTVDNTDGVRQATEHLIALGHREIGYIKGEEDHESTEARYRGYVDAMRIAGLPVDEARVSSASFSYASGFRVATGLLRDEGLTAVVCGSDLVAIGAMDAARSLGRAVPDDLSIVGFDDLPRASQNYPALTTVRQPLHDMGQAGARALISIIEGRPLAVDRMTLPTTLVLRDSTAAPRGVA